MHKFLLDFKKYKKYSGNKAAVVLFLTTQGLWALFVYRISNSIYTSSLPKLLKKIMLVFAVICQKWIEIVTGISIPYSASIGTEFYIGHFGGIIINAKAIIGNNCNISQGVTIGVSGRGDDRGVPCIGNHVYIGANATIVGNISIGDYCIVAANSLVTSTVLANRTVAGVPAKEVSDNTSKGYI